MRSWIQDPVTLKLIPKDEYYARETGKRLQIMGDITPFVSPVTGEVIHSRAQLREHNLKHGVTNIADYSPEFFAKKAKERNELLTGKSNRDCRINTILQAIQDHGG